MLADKSGTVVFCPPHPVAAVGGQDMRPFKDCPNRVPSTGVDMADVADAGAAQGYRWGSVIVEGTWDGHTVRVTGQRPAPPAHPAAEKPDVLPCPEPSGGWKIGPTQNDPNIDRVQAAVGPDFGALAMGWPKGPPTDSLNLTDAVEVVVAGTVGDVDAATAVIRRVYSGNLCVTRAVNSNAVIERQQAAMRTRLTTPIWSELGISSTAVAQQPLGNQVITVDGLAFDSRRLRELIDSIPGPRIGIDPWLTPMR